MNISYPGLDSSYAIPSVGWTSFDIDYVMVNGFPHRVAYAGNAEGVPVVLMSGVFEDDLSVFRWMIDEMIGLPNGGDFRFVMVTIPFFEEYAVPTYSMPPDFEVRYARFDGLDLVARKPVPQKGILPVDPRYDHRNQAKTLYSILRGGLNIEKAHFIGHDRGAVIIDYLLGEYPELALSYSRGSQGWTRYDPGWAALIDQGIMVGPPHGVFRTELGALLLKMLFTTGFPVLAASPAWMVQGRRGGSGYRTGPALGDLSGHGRPPPRTITGGRGKLSGNRTSPTKRTGAPTPTTLTRSSNPAFPSCSSSPPKR